MTPSTEKIFITGATGFLGSWIISRLIDRGIQVVATDISDDHRRLELLKPDLPRDLIDFRICDVRDAETLNTQIAETRPTGIIHLAALQIPQCRANPALGAAINIGGHINIFEAAGKHGIDRIIYTSSIAAKPRGKANAPSNFYGVFKKTDEEIARIYWEDHKLPSLGLRPYVVFGVGRDDGETSAITRAIEAAALGKSYEIPFTTRSCFQYAADVADVFVRAAVSSWDGALLSDVTDTVHSTDDVVAAIKEVVPQAAVSCADILRVSPSDGFDTSALKEIIGDFQERPLVEGIRETVNLYCEIAERHCLSDV
ncbi:NAD-dependent epimerase/dehydratase family protein [Roseibium marinum]|uniref:Nucleoside-diphosphate-sugar epimerase n=1 Tax=Roseibium marinum TaxID=281252 RepID=A0A2S3V281_9HYPH|nr:NAD(P)-dependent oxidoreductase [Roseibium marinum]POF33893.1 nucleoside-diphosphate-sugar epimerase [Roseibium marinum]